MIYNYFKKKVGNGVVVLGYNSSWVSMSCKRGADCSLLWNIISRMFIYQTTLEDRNSSSRAKSQHTTVSLWSKEQACLLPIIKYLQSLNSEFFSSNKTHYVNRCYLALPSVPCGNCGSGHWHK